MANRTDISSENLPTAASKQPSVAELREWYAKNEKRLQKYAVSEEAIRKLRDITKSITRKSVPSFDKETIVAYLQNPGANEKNLRNLSRYLYYRSHIYFRVIEFYSNMLMPEARTIIPRIDLVKGADQTKMLKSYNDTADILEHMNLNRNMKKVMTTVLREDVFYGFYWLDDTGMIVIPADPDYCIIEGITSYGNYLFAFDMSWFRSRQDILEAWGEPFISMYRAYENGEGKYQSVPLEHNMCFKFRDDYELIIPPWSGAFLEITDLLNLADLQAAADESSIYKLIYMKLKPLSGTDVPDDFEVDPSTAIEYYYKMLDPVLSDYVASAVIPGSDDLGVVDFSDNDGTSDTNRILKSQTSTLNLMGGAEVLAGANITSAEAFRAAMIANTYFALSSMVPQLEAWVSMVMDVNLNNASKVHFFIVSPFTKKDFQEQLLTGAQNGLPLALAYNNLNGFTEKDTLAMLQMQQMLNIPQILTPLQTSYTQSGQSGEVGQGAPEKDTGELSESGDRTRNQ